MVSCEARCGQLICDARCCSKGGGKLVARAVASEVRQRTPTPSSVSKDLVGGGSALKKCHVICATGLASHSLHGSPWLGLACGVNETERARDTKRLRPRLRVLLLGLLRSLRCVVTCYIVLTVYENRELAWSLDARGCCRWTTRGRYTQFLPGRSPTEIAGLPFLIRGWP